MGGARSLQQEMPAKPGTRVTRPLRDRIRWGNVARVAALLTAIPLFVVVLDGGGPPKPRRAEPAPPLVRRAPAEVPHARARPPRPGRVAERRRRPRRRTSRSHGRPARTGGRTTPPSPQAAPAPAPTSLPGEEFAPG